MSFALSQRKPGRANSNPEKHMISFLTEQYKSYCWGCGYPYKPLSKKGNTDEDRFVGSLEDLKSRLRKIFEDIDQGKFIVPNEPASGVVSADEVIGAELLGGFGTLSHIREIAADQFMGPMPAEVERLKVLNSCLPDLKFPWDAVEIADCSVDPPQEIKAFKPGAAFFEKDDEYYLISRGFFYDKKLENYVMYFIEGDTLQECLDQYDNVHTTSSPLCQYAWYYDIPGKCKGFLIWNLESIGRRGVDI